jgi:hypothetical protein
MDDATIQRIAAEVDAHLPTHLLVLLLLQLGLTGIVSGVAVFLSEYLRTRGKNLATRADFENLQQQLQANTELVETIKSEVGQRDWTKREWTNLRRVKLEAVLDKLHECEAYLEHHLHESVDGKTVPAERELGVELSTLQVLYFPELTIEVGAYLVIYRGLLAAGGGLVVKLLQAGIDLGARQVAFDEFAEKTLSSPAMLARNNAVEAVRSAARKLLVDIMGMD